MGKPRKKNNFSLVNSLRLQSFFYKYPSLFYITKWLMICIFLGLFIGSSSAFFLASLHWATDYRENHFWIILLLPIGGLGVGLLYYYFGKETEAGNNLLIDTIHKPGKRIPFIMAPLVLFGTIVTHLFGGSAGREGTALQMAGAIADQFTKPLRLRPRDRKILIIASISAGFGSVFGTPLAGAIFGLEVFLIGRIRYDAIFPAFAAAILADMVTKSWGVSHVNYVIASAPQISTEFIFLSIVVGLVSGVVAVLFGNLTSQCGKWFKKWIKYAPLRPFVGGVLVVAIVFLLGNTNYIGLGVPYIQRAFYDVLPEYDFMAKLMLTAITLGAGFKGGEVTPLFFIGATLGNSLSYFIPMPTGLLAAMGFVAVFSGATNTPLACTIMATELFGNGCGVYAAIACIVAYLVSGHNSIYHAQIVGQPKHVVFGRHQGKRILDLKYL